MSVHSNSGINRFLVVIPVFIFTALVCSKHSTESSYASADTITMASPRHESDISLEEAIYNRTSVREFSEEALSKHSVSQLLWAAGGKVVDGVSGASRAYPSAGGLYPLEIYIVVEDVDSINPGVYHYNWDQHSLERLKEGQVMDSLKATTYSRAFQSGYTPACVVITALYSRTTQKYGDRGEERYVPMDAGGSAQNVHLQAVALDLNTFPIGAFDGQRVKEVLGIQDSNEVPMFLIPVGSK